MLSFIHYVKIHFFHLRYHDQVPEEVPALDSKATFGLVSPIDFQMPDPNSIWSFGVYKALAGFESAEVGKEKDLPPVKEDEIHSTNKDPKNESGCSLQ